MDTYINLSLFRLSSFFFWYSLFPLSHTLSFAEQNVHFTLFKISSHFSVLKRYRACSFQTLILLKTLAGWTKFIGCGPNKLSQCWYLSACQFKNLFLEHHRSLQRSALTKEKQQENIVRMQRLQMNGSRLPLMKIMNSPVVNQITLKCKMRY